MQKYYSIALLSSVVPVLSTVTHWISGSAGIVVALIAGFCIGVAKVESLMGLTLGLAVAIGGAIYSIREWGITNIFYIISTVLIFILLYFGSAAFASSLKR